MFLQNSATITASTQTEDVLVNNLLASNFRMPYGVRWAVVASGTGLLVSVKVGLMTVADIFRPSLLNRFPVDPDDYCGRFGVVPGDRIILTCRNTTGGDLTLFFAFRFQPISMRR